MVPEIVCIRTVDDDGEAAISSDGRQLVPQFRLAEVTPVRGIRRVARIAHLIGVHLQHRNREATRDVARTLPLLGRI